MTKRIGTIIHGALGDCYEQLCAIKILKAENPERKWIGFFAVRERMDAMLHFKLDMLEEVYPVDELLKVQVDEFYQFQIKDVELREYVIDRLPQEILHKFNFGTNILPWHALRSIDYAKTGLGLELSESGQAYLPECYRLNGLTDELFTNKLTIGYLWRYRRKGGAINPLFQKSQEWILKTKSELFNELINKYNAHIIIAGMGKLQQASAEISTAQGASGVVTGEINSKYTDARLDIPVHGCTYLKGLGYAAEMEIMARCDLILMMPSGFSEPLWMKRKSPVLLMDPPPVYLAKLWRNRMPFFNNKELEYAVYNALVEHNKTNVMKFLSRHDMLKKMTP